MFLLSEAQKKIPNEKNFRAWRSGVKVKENNYQSVNLYIKKAVNQETKKKKYCNKKTLHEGTKVRKNEDVKNLE